MEEVGLSVELFLARLDREVDDAAGRVSELGGELLVLTVNSWKAFGPGATSEK